MAVQYFKSEILQKDGKINTITGEVTIKDLSDITKNYVTYIPDEIEILKNQGDVDPYLHKLKKMFGGKLTEHIKLSELRMKGVVKK